MTRLLFKMIEEKTDYVKLLATHITKMLKKLEGEHEGLDKIDKEI